MKQVEQVFPVEAAAPPKLKATLRPYQAQSLAFMVGVETSADPSLTSCSELLKPSESEAYDAPVRGGWLCDEVGMGKTCVCAALILAQPAPAPKGRAAQDMRDLCARSDKHKRWTVKIGDITYQTAGYANDLAQPEREMTPLKRVEYQERQRGKDGLVKMVTRSRMDLDNSKPKQPNPEAAKWTPPPKVTLPITVVLTTNALLGQWHDELKKFAPSLRVRWYYCTVHGSNEWPCFFPPVCLPRRSLTVATPWTRPATPGCPKHKIYPDLMNTDVVLSTHGTTLFAEGSNGRCLFSKFIRIHRVIIDESHGRDAIGNAIRSLCRGFQFAWGVTGTPLSSSVRDLHPMASVIGHWKDGLQLGQYEENAQRAQLPDVLKRLMIRHTKGQRIGGQAALALPEAECATIWVDMSPSERKVYGASSRAARLKSLEDEPEKAKTFAVENAIVSRRQACCGAGVLPRCLDGRDSGWRAPSARKLQVLLDDLDQLLDVEPALHAVVFTHHTDAYSKISSALEKAGFVVCGFTGGVAAAERHRTIRQFQESAEASTAKGPKKAKVTPKVFVATMKAGNVGSRAARGSIPMSFRTTAHRRP